MEKKIKEWVVLERIAGNSCDLTSSKPTKEGVPSESRRIELDIVKNRPVYEGDTYARDPRISIRISYKNKVLILPADAYRALIEFVGASKEQTLAAIADCDAENLARYQERMAMREMRDRRAYAPPDDKEEQVPYTSGKTARRKAAGKAGEQYTRQKRMEHAQQSREVNSNMGKPRS